MLCQNCKSKEATTHVKRIINGEMEEFHLCGSCSEKLGYGNFFSDMPLNLENFLGNFFIGGSAAAPHIHDTQTHCQTCGCAFTDIINSGRVGCADCYTTFYDRLLPSLQRIHGKTHHVGRIPNSAGTKAKTAAKIDSLRRELNGAISEQNYERAAELRDEIKLMESEGISDE